MEPDKIFEINTYEITCLNIAGNITIKMYDSFLNKAKITLTFHRIV